MLSLIGTNNNQNNALGELYNIIDNKIIQKFYYNFAFERKWSFMHREKEYNKRIQVGC